MKRIIKERLPIRRRKVSKAEALDFYQNDPYKQEIISELGDASYLFMTRGISPTCAGGRTCRIPGLSRLLSS
jgi:threonyl-tRNA synthetase